MAENSNVVETVMADASLAPEPSLASDRQTPEFLTAEGFRAVLLEIDALGLTWTAELPPQLVAKNPKESSSFASEKLQQIEDRYPSFPNELGYVIWYALTGTLPLTDAAGTEADLRAKAEIVRDSLITPEFRDEFFFSQMVKLSCFENIDWEVIVKTSERGVKRFPGNAYALVTLLMKGNSNYGENRETVTFAINETRLEKLLTALGGMRVALKHAREYGVRLRQSEGTETDAGL